MKATRQGVCNAAAGLAKPISIREGHVMAVFQSTIKRFLNGVVAILIVAVLCLYVCGWYYAG